MFTKRIFIIFILLISYLILFNIGCDSESSAQKKKESALDQAKKELLTHTGQRETFNLLSEEGLKGVTSDAFLKGHQGYLVKGVEGFIPLNVKETKKILILHDKLDNLSLKMTDIKDTEIKAESEEEYEGKKFILFDYKKTTYDNVGILNIPFIVATGGSADGFWFVFKEISEEQ